MSSLTKIPENSINPENPFETDYIGNREKYAKAIKQLILNTPNSFVLSINGSWGSGKTTFLKMLNCYLNSHNFGSSEQSDKNIVNTLYFSAWETDHCQDPLVAILAELTKKLNSKTSALYTASPELKSQFTQAAKKLAKNSLKIGTKWVANILKIDKDTQDLIADSFSNIEETENPLDFHNQRMELINSFKMQLKKFAQSTSENPLVVLIDELDRCRPDYAVELLESIKHIFNIDEVIFVLGLSKKQLGNSIKSLYGNDVDIDGYLHRFIDFDFNLDIGNNSVDITKFYSNLLKKLIVPDLPNYTVYESCFIELDYFFKLTPRLKIRAIERFNLYLIFSEFSDDFNKLSALGVIFLIMLKISNQDSYEKLISFELTYKSIYEDIFSEIMPKGKIIVDVEFKKKVLSMDLIMTRCGHSVGQFIPVDKINNFQDASSDTSLKHYYMNAEWFAGDLEIIRNHVSAAKVCNNNVFPLVMNALELASSFDND